MRKEVGMKENKHYFSLKFKGGNDFHKTKTCLNFTERIVNIGETIDCDVRYDSEGFQPEYYASILLNEDGKTWRIVKRSQHAEIFIDGKGSVGYAQQLNDGDILRFGNHRMALGFHTHFDNRYDEEGQDKIWRWSLTVVLLMIVAFAVALGYFSNSDEITSEEVEPFEESVYWVKVDSVSRVIELGGKINRIPPTLVLMDDAPVGTAFLTTEGLLITARHCVEFWIGENLDLTTKVEELSENDIVRWAIEAETFNQIHHSDTVMRLSVSFTIYDFMGNKRHSFTTTDPHVYINKSKDGIFLLADFSQDYYWRTIRPYYTDRQMELGDIICIENLSEKGKIKLATEEQLKNVKKGTELIICGYPMTGIGDRRMTFTEGIIRRNSSIENENLFFESNINHGFSGGPVLMKAGGDIVAIGVVSRVDSISSGLYKWAVPVTEIDRKECETNGM